MPELLSPYRIYRIETIEGFSNWMIARKKNRYQNVI